MIVSIIILLLGSTASKSSQSSAPLKENDPRYCRCGEARVGEKVTPRDIQDWNEETTTTEALAHITMALYSIFSQQLALLNT